MYTPSQEKQLMGGSILGVDYGKVRIGLALSQGLLASPAGYVLNKGAKKNFFVFKDIIMKHNIEKVVVGLPLHTDGSESPMAAEARAFGDWLQNQFGVAVVFHDERYTSREAEELIREKMLIKDPRKIAEMVDSIAANMILNSWLRQN